MLIIFVTFASMAENPADSVSAKGSKKKDEVKSGWVALPLPVVAFNSDIGFQYGALCDLYYYGKPTWYPDFQHNLYFEISRTTKGGRIYQAYFDSKRLIKGIRFTSDITYLIEKALNFYGFNGYKAVYNRDWENDRLDTSVYKSRQFYRYERQLLKVTATFQGKFLTPKLRWLAGVSFVWVDIKPVDIERLNRGLPENKKLPYIPGLYDLYSEWNILKPAERDGGWNNYIRIGLIYDSRDNEAFTTRGIWSELIFQAAPPYIGNGEYSFLKFSAVHRQFLPLAGENLVFAYRLGYQGNLLGEAPFYIEPIMITSVAKTTTIDGLGGSNTVRGVLRDRVIGDGFAYGNLELRWTFYRFKLFNQNFYFAVNAFTDAGMVTQERPVDKSGIPTNIDQSQYFSNTAEYPHVGVGGGFHIIYNRSTIIAFDFGQPIDRRDGQPSFYVGIGSIF